MFIEVNGINLFYEKTGQGKPIILLHGNGGNHEIFDVLTNQLANQYTVYGIDSRGHGQSSEVKEYHYVTMMEDIASFIQALKLDKPILYGFSDGGILGLLLASRYPKMLSKLIISGANTIPTGLKNAVLISSKFHLLFKPNELVKMMVKEPHIKKSEIEKIIVPTLVLAGENDIIKDNHTRYIAKHIPNSTLIVLKGEDHGSYIVHNKKIFEVMAPFLKV